MVILGTLKIKGRGIFALFFLLFTKINITSWYNYNVLKAFDHSMSRYLLRVVFIVIFSTAGSIILCTLLLNVLFY